MASFVKLGEVMLPTLERGSDFAFEARRELDLVTSSLYCQVGSPAQLIGHICP